VTRPAYGRAAACVLALSALGFGACATAPRAPVPDVPLQGDGTSPPPADRPPGIADELKALVETGTPPSLLRALDLIRSRDLGQTEFGRVMSAVAVTILRSLYPEVSADLPAADPPPTERYARILRDAQKGAYTPAAGGSEDFLEHVLPFFALLDETRSERLARALPDLRRAAVLNTGSVLAPYFLGLVAERTATPGEAREFYAAAYALSADCYPAALGMARVYIGAGQIPEAVRLLSDLVSRYPDNYGIKRSLALAYYQAGDWSRAGPALAEILQRNPKDRAFLLMRAHVLVEQGQFLQAQPLLDAYAATEAVDRLYLFLKARIQSEAYRNDDAALTYLRSILRTDPQDGEAAVFAARLLMGSSRPEDQEEGRRLLAELLKTAAPAPAVLDLALRDAIRREAWKEALPYVETLLLERRSAPDLVNAYTVQRGLRNNAAALAPAKELYDRDPGDETGVSTYIAALIGAGRREEAGRMIDERLSTLPGGSVKSRYYYLRSRMKTDEEAVMNDLRSSLFEDPRNLDALIAMLEVYDKRKDERRAVYYLKQALALAPDNPTLQKYRTAYIGLLGTR